MKTILNALALVLACFAASPLYAYDMGDNNLLVPIAARTGGAYGSQWRTDLVITNLQPEPASVFVTFHAGATSEAFTNRTLPAFGTLVLEDVLSRTLMIDQGIGMLRVNSASANARFTARAYVYNRGQAGEFGQGVPAVPIDALGQQHVIGGIVMEQWRRTNFGVANPWSTDTDVILVLHSATGEVVGQHALTVGAESVVQINDVLRLFDAGFVSNGSIRVLSSLPVYPYASVVRNDTNDAVFVAGSGIARTPDVISAGCSEPAPLIRPFPGEAPAEETTLEFVAGVTRPFMEAFAAQHKFVITAWSDSAPAVAARLTPQQIAAVRCDPALKVVRRDGVFSHNN